MIKADSTVFEKDYIPIPSINYVEMSLSPRCFLKEILRIRLMRHQSQLLSLLSERIPLIQHAVGESRVNLIWPNYLINNMTIILFD